MERYIAIDNVCAWPNLTKMPDGAILATIYNQPCHGHWEGDVECWASEDGGRSWRLRGTAAPHEPGTNRMNIAAGLAANGDLVVLASGWSDRRPKSDGLAAWNSEAHCLPVWVCRSSDGGRTWSHTETLMPPEGVDHVVPFGDIVVLADSNLGVSVYTHGSAYFYHSSDDGRTWTHRSTIQNKGLTETTVLALPDGQVLACARTEGDEHLELFRSLDCGKTWAHEQAVSFDRQIPAHLLDLGDGRILLSYGDRRQDHGGIEARVSNDEGRSWGPPLRIVDLEVVDHEYGGVVFGDLGYPATVPGDDGTLVTAWYSKGTAAHQRYHMGAAVWRLEESEQASFSPNLPVHQWMLSDLTEKPTGGITDAEYRSLGESLGWQTTQAVDSDGFVNVHARHGDADGIVYLANRFTVPRDGDWGLSIGHDGGIRVFIDGDCVLTTPETRNPAVQGRSRTEAALTAGEHDVVIAFDTAAGKGWGIYFEWLMPRADRRFPATVQ